MRALLRVAAPSLLLSSLSLPVPAAAADPTPPTSGVYEMTGVTVDRSTGLERPIQGTIVVKVAGDRYTTNFEFSTLYPGSEATAARVTGTGEGKVEGSRLVGEAHLQLTVAAAPGVDVGFAYIPRDVSPRVRSTSTASFFADGSVRAEIENVAEAGSDYSPTRTTMTGHRRNPAESKPPPSKPAP